MRELEKQIQADLFDHIVTNGGNLTVLKLVEKYIDTKTGVRPTTQAGYNTVINVLKNDNFGKKRIDTDRISDAKTWLIKLQKKDGRSYSSSPQKAHSVPVLPLGVSLHLPSPGSPRESFPKWSSSRFSA